MNKKFFRLLLAGSVVLSSGLLTGCINTVDDRSRMGVPFIKDEVEGNYQRSPEQVHQAARAVLKSNGGLLVSDDSVSNTLEATFDHERVWVHVEEADSTKQITRVVVETRTISGASDLDLAHEIEKQIALQLVRQ